MADPVRGTEERLISSRSTSDRGTTDSNLAGLETELSEVIPIVNRLAKNVTSNPKDVALNEVKGVAARLATDLSVLAAIEKSSQPLSQDVQRSINTIRQLKRTIDGVLGTADRWHTANPADESLGMKNERVGTKLATSYLKDVEKGDYVSAMGAAAAAAAVSLSDDAERWLSFGFHDTATAVSEAYSRGDISWNEGCDALWSAAGRAIITAAITRGAHVAGSRLGVTLARGVGLAPLSLGYGAVSGGVAGGLSGTAALASDTLVTKALEGWFQSPAGRAIWNQGVPSGTRWAMAIPLRIRDTID